MKVMVEKPLQDYLVNHNHHTLTVEMKTDWDIQRTHSHPHVKYAVPKDQDRFEAFKVDDITVYVERGIQPENDILDIDDKRILGVHRFEVKGIKRDDAPPLKLL